MSETTSSISSYKFTDEDINMFNSIKNPTNKLYTKLSYGGIGGIFLYVGILLIWSLIWLLIALFTSHNDILDKIDTLPYKILVNKIYIPIQIILFIYAFIIGGITFSDSSMSTYDKKLLELYKIITVGTDISYENIRANKLKENLEKKIAKPESGLDEDTKSNIEANNYFDIFKDYFNKDDLDVLKSNYKLGLVNIILGVLLLIIFIIICFKLDKKYNPNPNK